MYLLLLVVDIAGVLITSTVAGAGSFGDMSQRIMAAETLYRIGLCCGLVGSLVTILLAIGLYVTVKPADGNLALMALLFRVVEATIGATGTILAFNILQIHVARSHASAFDANQLGALANFSSGVGTDVGAIFFSVGSTIFFYLFLTSRYIPRILSAWGIFASLVYTMVWFVSLVLPQYAETAVLVGSLPILLAELSTGFWLLIAGIKVQPST
jgi:hypothetical protein